MRFVGLAMLSWGLILCRAPSAVAEESIPSLEEGIRAVEPGVASTDLAADTSEHLAGVKPVRLSMEFQDAPLKDVLRVFSQQSGINVIASGEVSEALITLYFEDVAVMDALDQILRAGNLTYERPQGSDIYIVSAKMAEPAQAAPTLISRLYKLRYARISKAILTKAAAAFSSRTPYEAAKAGDSEDAGGSSGGGTNETVGIDTVIQELLTEQGTVVVDTRTNSMIVTDVASNFPRIEAALATLDVRTPQILIDAELIETTLSKSKDLGVEWGTGSEGDLFSILPASRETRFPFSQMFGDQGRSRTDPPEITLGRVTFGSTGTTSALAVLQALESDTDTKILARPKVLTLDNETAVIRLTSDEAIGLKTSAQQSTGTSSSEPERTKTGVILSVTPQINADGYITMLVEPAVTKTVASKLTNVPSTQATPRDPKTRSARTLVRIRSGDTLVLGGLIDRSEEVAFRRTPILSGIPIFGEAFKNQENSNNASELLVFVTPTIIDEPAVETTAVAVAPMSLREQEPSGDVRGQSIEEALIAHEQP
jgi:type IV pilus assembly protein PilQ